MNISPVLDLHPELHNEFHFADDTESKGCCCFWKSRPVRKENIDVSQDHVLRYVSKTSHRQRIIANQRLAELVEFKFEKDPIENEKAFQMLKIRINEEFQNGDPITSDRLVQIITAIYEIRKEVGGFEDYSIQ